MSFSEMTKRFERMAERFERKRHEAEVETYLQVACAMVQTEKTPEEWLRVLTALRAEAEDARQDGSAVGVGVQVRLMQLAIQTAEEHGFPEIAEAFGQAVREFETVNMEN